MEEPEKDSLLVTVESSFSADNGSHHCFYWMALALFDPTRVVFVPAPTLAGTKMQALSGRVRMRGCFRFVGATEEKFLQW